MKPSWRWACLYVPGNTSILIWLNHLWHSPHHKYEAIIVEGDSLYSTVEISLQGLPLFFLKIGFCCTILDKIEGGHTETGT